MHHLTIMMSDTYDDFQEKLKGGSDNHVMMWLDGSELVN